MKRTGFLISLVVVLFLPFSVWASDAPEDRENFKRKAEIMRKYPMARLRFIEACTTFLLENVNDDESAEIERLNDMSAARLFADICGRIVRGMASGELTYDIYMQWLSSLDDGAGFMLPDYK